MGCFHSFSLNRVDLDYILNSNDILYLIQSWNVIKIHNLEKFGHDILIRIINQNPSIRQYWKTKIQVDPNNYDFSQSDSCLRTDLSWYIALRDYSNQFISIFDQLISVIRDKNHFQTFIQSINISENIFSIEHDTLLITKQSFLESLRERFKIYNYDFTNDYERVWEKFLTYIIDYIIKQKNSMRLSTTINHE